MKTREEYLSRLIVPDETTKLLDLRTYPLTESRINEQTYQNVLKKSLNKFLESDTVPIVFRKHLLA